MFALTTKYSEWYSHSFSATNAGIDSLYQLRLLSALRSGEHLAFQMRRASTDPLIGDPARIHPFLADFTKDRRTSSDASEVDLGAAALHLAIRCATCECVGDMSVTRLYPNRLARRNCGPPAQSPSCFSECRTSSWLWDDGTTSRGFPVQKRRCDFAFGSGGHR